MKAIISALAVAILFGCYHPDGLRNDSTPEKGTLNYTWESSCDESKEGGLTITTVYFPSEKVNVRFGMYPLNQSITLLDGTGAEVRLESLPFKSQTDSISTVNIEVLDCIVTNARCVQIGDKLLYSLYGGGTIDPPREFFGLLSVERGWLWWYYGDQHEIYSEYGDIDSINQIYGEDILADLNGMESTLPH